MPKIPIISFLIRCPNLASRKVVYVVPEGFDLKRQRIKNLEFRKAKYGEDVEKQLAQTKERTFRIASAALWDSPIPVK